MNARDLLRKKIVKVQVENFFAKNPNATSVVLRSPSRDGICETFWRAVKTKDSFQITEISSLKTSYVITEEESEEIPDNAGIETAAETPEDTDVQVEPEPEAEEPAPPSPEKKKTEDQSAVGRTLKGQTLAGAEFELSNSGGALVLDLVGSNIPARLEWKRNGEIVYYFNGVPYVIKSGE